MPTIDASDGRLALLATGVRLVFRWSGDRWSHAIEVDRDGTSLVLACSIEGEADPTRVISPAFQQLHPQRPPDDPDAVQALLVGQSGPHHVSAVFSLREASGGVRIAVEIADRCRADVVALASTYVVDLPSSHLQDASPSAIRWELPGTPPGSILLEADAPTRLDLREAGRRGAQVQAAGAIVPGRSTQTWTYRWAIGQEGSFGVRRGPGHGSFRSL